MGNKEVITKLEELFAGQSHETLAKMAASILIDLNRFLHFDHLSSEQRESLTKRTAINMSQINEYLDNGNPENIMLIDIKDCPNYPVKEGEA